jgi:hypothetical protein
MDTPNTKPESSLTEVFESFPEPRTIPMGWDVSELLPPSASTTAEETETVCEATYLVST